MTQKFISLIIVPGPASGHTKVMSLLNANHVCQTLRISFLLQLKFAHSHYLICLVQCQVTLSLLHVAPKKSTHTLSKCRRLQKTRKSDEMKPHTHTHTHPRSRKKEAFNEWEESICEDVAHFQCFKHAVHTITNANHNFSNLKTADQAVAIILVTGVIETLHNLHDNESKKRYCFGWLLRLLSVLQSSSSSSAFWYVG